MGLMIFEILATCSPSEKNSAALAPEFTIRGGTKAFRNRHLVISSPRAPQSPTPHPRPPTKMIRSTLYLYLVGGSMGGAGPPTGPASPSGSDAQLGVWVRREARFGSESPGGRGTTRRLRGRFHGADMPKEATLRCMAVGCLAGNAFNAWVLPHPERAHEIAQMRTDHDPEGLGPLWVR